MAVTELNLKEQHYADTREEAEKVVEQAKEDEYLTSFKISEKYNKFGIYYLIDLAFSYSTPKDVMQSKPSKDVEVEEKHDGVEYSVNEDGTVSVENNTQEVE